MTDHEYAPKDSRDVTGHQNTPGKPTGWRGKEDAAGAGERGDLTPDDSRAVTAHQNAPGEPTGWQDDEKIRAHERANEGPLPGGASTDARPPEGVGQDRPFSADDAARGVGPAQGSPDGGVAHRIREGMEVVSDEGAHIGTVAGIERDEIVLGREASSGEGQEYVPLSLVDYVDGNRVIIRARGDNVFGEEAAH